MKRNFFSFLATFLLLSVAFANTIDITTLGAKGDGKTLNTLIIQKAINDISKVGGTVFVPTGNFVTGTLYLKSNVTLFLEKGATLLGSIDSVDYPMNSPTTIRCVSTHSNNGRPRRNFSLIYADNQENISIAGEGTIDGRGNNKYWQRGDNGANRPKLIFIIACKNVVVKDVLLTNSCFWMQDYLGCDGVKLLGLRVISHANYNNDGIDVDSKNVIISNCYIDSDDDAICLKSYLADKPCENVVVTNCVIKTNCNAIKFGTPGKGGFKNITVDNCSISASQFDNFRKWSARFKNISASPASVSGISIECVDGGVTEDINISNITMKSTLTPIFIRLGNRMEKLKDDTTTTTSSLKNVIISNIIAESHSHRTSSITAYPGTYVENVQLHHISIDVMGGGTIEERNVENVKEKDKGYPSPNMFGESLPAYGFYVRHVDGISIEDVQLNLLNADARYALVFDDTKFAYIRNIKVKSQDGKTKFVENKDIKRTENSRVFAESSPKEWVN